MSIIKRALKSLSSCNTYDWFQYLLFTLMIPVPDHLTKNWTNNLILETTSNGNQNLTSFYVMLYYVIVNAIKIFYSFSCSPQLSFCGCSLSFLHGLNIVFLFYDTVNFDESFLYKQGNETAF